MQSAEKDGSLEKDMAEIKDKFRSKKGKNENAAES